MTDKNENARDKFFSALNAEAHNKMMAVFEEAFSDHDVVPEAKANGQGRDNPDTPDHVGTGNTTTLTDKEREAIEFFTGFHTEGYGAIEIHAATLRTLLERTK